MPKVNIVAFPYRDAYFFHDFGPAVRDLQILLELSKLSQVEKITIVNRPVSWPEKLISKSKVRVIEKDKFATLNYFSKDLIAPLYGRRWIDKVYDDYVKDILDNNFKKGSINVVIDFLPIGANSISKCKGQWFYWYDLIDNFSKHNRFSCLEKKLVVDKYHNASKSADLITAVSDKALLSVPDNNRNKIRKTFPNRVFNDGIDNNISATPKFDFGFIGFVTDKLDLDYILELSNNYTVAIYGKFFDEKVKKQLETLNNVYIMGAFKYSEIPNIVATFKVGLMPYLVDKSHDESPLKMYEYIKNDTPCLTSMDFELDNNYIFNYKKDEVDYEKVFRISKDRAISESISENMLLSHQIQKIIEVIVEYES